MSISKADLTGLAGVELALYWARQGMRVLPVIPRPATGKDQKRPLIKAWQDHCTTDETTIREWWLIYPYARVGIATGDPGFDAVDFDVAEGKPGLEQLDKLIELGIIEPGTFYVVATPSGGRHLLFKGSDQRNKQNEKAIPGVDFRGQGGMVLAAGNDGYELKVIPHAGLGPVSWDEIGLALAPPDPPTAPVPPPVTRTAPARPHMPPAPSQAAPVDPGRRMGRFVDPIRAYDDPIGEESPLDWYTRNHDIEHLLADAGWQFAYEADGKRHFVRPGKKRSEGSSGNVATMHDGRRVFYNFSSSTTLPVNTALSVAQLYAHLYHGGSQRDAASTIRRTLMPHRERPTMPLPSSPATQTAPARPDIPPQPQTAGTALVPVSLNNPPEQVRSFWFQRPELAEIWFQANETGYSPWAILGYVLAMVSVRVGPHIVLPPRNRQYGGPASLNLFVAITGDTGDGKDEASKIARPFVGPPHVPTRKPGTGQGIAALFTEMHPKQGPIQVNDTAHLHHSEVSGLGAHADMQGSNLVDTLLSVFMAQELGEHYANKEKRRPVKEHAYRLALTVGVQPSNSHVLLDDERAGSGLPQRFLWMPAIWPDAIPEMGGFRLPAPGPEVPAWRAESWILPGSLDDTINPDGTEWSPTDAVNSRFVQPHTKKDDGETPVPVKEQITIEYEPRLWREIQRITRERLLARKRAKVAGERTSGAADSHLTLTQLKVAALLSIWLDRSLTVSWECWELASSLIWVSNQTRIESANELAKKVQDKTAVRAAAQAALKDIVKRNEDAGHVALTQKVSDRIRTVVGKADGEWVAYRDIALGLAGRDKKALREAGIEIADVLGDLMLVGVLEQRPPEGKEQGDRYRIRK